MLFASTTLVARIERAECRMMTACAAAVAGSRPEVDVLSRDFAGGVAIFAGEDSPLNKVAGIGFAGPVDPRALDALEVEYDRRRSPVPVELSCLADPSVGALLTGRGYVLRGFENVLGRALSVPAASRTPVREGIEGIEVTVCARADFDTWLDVLVTGFTAPDLQGVPSHESFPRDVLERVAREMETAEGFVRYLAHRDGAPAGAGAMRITDGIAQLCGSATVPEQRRRGIQTALLGHRLDAAVQSGCDVAVVTTQPGSKSMENVQRRGFDLLYTRAVLVRGD